MQRQVALGDSFCHTDPTFALGISNAFIQGAALCEASAAHPDAEVATAFYAKVGEELRERFEFARDVSAARVDRMRGRLIAISRASCYPLYSLMATLSCAGLDPQIHRMAYRRHGFLDRLTRFDRDEALQQKVDELFAQVLARMRDVPRLDRADLVAMIEALRLE